MIILFIAMYTGRPAALCPKFLTSIFILQVRVNCFSEEFVLSKAVKKTTSTSQRGDQELRRIVDEQASTRDSVGVALFYIQMNELLLFGYQ